MPTSLINTTPDISAFTQTGFITNISQRHQAGPTADDNILYFPPVAIIAHQNFKRVKSLAERTIQSLSEKYRLIGWNGNRNSALLIQIRSIPSPIVSDIIFFQIPQVVIFFPDIKRGTTTDAMILENTRNSG
ncbi:MAG: hypothetical protein ABT03_00575 [Comamonas sp. SCN 67-35]|nr:MAG: hypothetical protein ABT03_00575 [Comamonas sp. SCN 67-35]OJW97163.1 MAG: hypothetical protein BGO73_08640 [Burkholderiales bacterium 66-26]